ncbi:hypothetical protein [Sphingobium cloacae]|uniref:hypothetical protein n=1 Tax=Sphingobium cloacae TaxID=120107 RepID=UPI0012EEDECB|nr:hypothetical protein [Sphingobium cloacae]
MAFLNQAGRDIPYGPHSSNGFLAIWIAFMPAGQPEQGVASVIGSDRSSLVTPLSSV